MKIVALLLCLLTTAHAAPDAGLPALDHSLDPPPPPPRTAAKVLIGTGALMSAVGLAGLIFKSSCVTWDEEGRCTDPGQVSAAFPTLLVLGLATAITGNSWYHRDAPEAR